MNPNVLTFLFCVLGLFALCYLLLLDRRKATLLRLRVKKMHASPLFGALSPLLKGAQRLMIDELRLEKTGLSIRYVSPPGSVQDFSFHQRGFANLSPEKLEALFVLLEDYLPQMSDKHLYKLRRWHTRQINGQMDTVYTYSIRTDYKNRLVRAPYYDGTRQELWE